MYDSVHYPLILHNHDIEKIIKGEKTYANYLYSDR